MRTPRARVEREAPERVDDREREGQARHAPVADAPEGRGEHVELHEDDDEVEVAEARARRELEEEPRRARRRPVVLELVLQGAQLLVETLTFCGSAWTAACSSSSALTITTTNISHHLR